MSKNPSYFLEHPENLQEDNLDYAKLTYSEICKIRAGKAQVYRYKSYEDEVPIMEIYGDSGKTGSRWALIKGEWTRDVPSHMWFGEDVYIITVDKFLESVKKAELAHK